MFCLNTVYHMYYSHGATHYYIHGTWDYILPKNIVVDVKPEKMELFIIELQEFFFFCCIFLEQLFSLAFSLVTANP